MPPRANIQELHQWAERRGGRCLSTTYVNNKTDYLWECGRCHRQWKATWYNVHCHYSWCPNCNSSTREQVVRAAFRECFPGEGFHTDRKEIGMELDGYSPRFRIAFEHDGIQHRVRVDHFQRTDDAFEKQIARDRKKDQLCFDNWIVLFRVPDKGILQLQDIRDFVRSQLVSAGITISPKLLSDPDFLQGAVSSTKKDYIGECRERIRARKGTLESVICPTRSFPITVRCQQWHSFETTYDQLERGRWCPHCAKNRKKTDEELQGLAARCGYTLQGSEMIKEPSGKTRRRLTVLCPAHGPFQTLMDNLRAGKRCPTCAQSTKGSGRRLKVEEINEQIKAKGVILCSSYVNNDTPATFRCMTCHETLTSTLKKIKEDTVIACVNCRVHTFRPMVLTESLPRDPPTTKKFSWACLTCGSADRATIRGMMLRFKRFNYHCRNKKCPSRS